MEDVILSIIMESKELKSTSMIKKTIFEEILHKKESFDIVRNTRINFSLRMKKIYHAWDTCFFIFNFSAISLFVTSVFLKDGKLGFISGIYSIYIILLQYTISKLRFHEKYQLAEQNQLLIEEKINRLKKIYRLGIDKILNKESLEMEYHQIYSEYLKELEYFPNNSNCDYRFTLLQNEKNELIDKFKKEIDIKVKKDIRSKKIKNRIKTFISILEMNLICIIINIILALLPLIYISFIIIW